MSPSSFQAENSIVKTHLSSSIRKDRSRSDAFALWSEKSTDINSWFRLDGYIGHGMDS